MPPWTRPKAHCAGLGLLLAVACAPAPTPRDSPLAPAVAVASRDVPTATETPAAPRLDGATVSHPGCFTLLELGTDTPLRLGDQPCEERTIPASTFKIPHALIALDTGVVTDPNALVRWDGTRYRSMKAWERDHSLRSAVYESVVWFFQGTARAIGRERMTEYLQAFGYGNATVDGPIDRFWLDGGSVQVSPDEQVRFLADLYLDRLPRGQAHVPVLREMLVRPPSSFAGRVAEGTTIPALDPAATLSAKTGTGRHGEGSVTWLVGHVACPQHQYVFASRVIADAPPGRLSPATTHGLAALDELAVLRCDGP
ncbi:MAG: penicillin-binding transpeptidase domain-containing protein [Nannocystaceae bacterium]